MESLVLLRVDGVGQLPENPGIRLAAQKAKVQPLFHGWRGPLTVFRQLQGGKMGNVTLGDFRDVMDYLGWYLPDRQAIQYVAPSVAAPKYLSYGTHLPAHGVAIASVGELSSHYRFEPVMIPERHPMRQGAGLPSSVFEKLGYPIIPWKTGKTSRKGRSSMTWSLNNRIAQALCLTLDLDSSLRGHLPEAEFEQAGIVFAVRADGAPLSTVQVEQTFRWAKNKLLSGMIRCNAGREYSPTRREIMRGVRWESVLAYAKWQLEIELNTK